MGHGVEGRLLAVHHITCGTPNGPHHGDPGVCSDVVEHPLLVTPEEPPIGVRVLYGGPGTVRHSR